MKVKAACLLCLAVLLIFLVGYNIGGSSSKGDERFVELEGSGTILSNKYKIVYDRTTKVMYYMTDNVYNYGSLCPLYNADGSIMTYSHNNVESGE